MNARRKPVLMYHDVKPTMMGETSIYSIAPSVLRDQLAVIKDLGGVAVPAREIPTATVSAVGITFDDGRKGVIEHALPLLAEAGMKATLFMTASLIDGSGWCSEQELATWVGCGHEVGTHGWTHESMTALSPVDAAQQMKRSKETLEDFSGHPVVSMSFPNGRLSSGLVRMAKGVGLDVIFGSWPGYGAGVSGAYGRFAILDRTSERVFRQIIRGRGWLAYTPQRALFVLGRLVGERAYGRLQALLRGA